MLAIRRAGIAVLASALFAGAVFLVAAAAKAGDAIRQAAAQAAPVPAKPAGEEGRLEAVYTATLAGIPIGRGNWVIDITDDQYSAAASGTTTGILRLFTGARGTGTAQGTTNGGQLVPTNYAATINYDHKIDDVHIALANGNVKDFYAQPPLPPHPDRIPVSDADRRGVTDPMTSALNHVGGNGDPVSPEACNRKVAVFDGRVRYDLHSEFRRMEVVKAEQGYQGPAVVCAVYFTPISGYVPERPAIKFLIELRDAEVWLAPISGTRVLAPYRFSMPTPIGVGVLQATHFVSVAQPAQPAHAAAKTQ